MSSINSIRNNYFFNAFFWSTFSKVLSAILGFITVPLLLGYFGKANYGILSIATACNGYMHLMDLGMNIGAVKFFSQWSVEGNKDKIYRVAKTNITFYIIIALINIIGLLALAIWGEGLFNVSHDQFLQLRECFYILALFAVISWVSTAFNQLLIADKQVAFTMQVQSILTVLKLALIGITLYGKLSLTNYFFWLTFIVVLAIVPYIWRCKKYNLIDSIKPARYWEDFKVVILFSLSLFALSLFQVTASQSQPILLGIFAYEGADVVADYRIVEVIPLFITMLSGSFTSIFLPKTSELVVRNDKEEINGFVKKWTSLTTIIVCVLCFPFVISNEVIINAYVGNSYSYLGKWVALWCVFLIIQLHSTPAFSLVLATGKTKVLVYFTGIACVVSMIINIALCKIVPVGSAVIGYCSYMIILIIVYYVYFYKRYLNLSRWMLLKSFIKPVALAVLACIVPYFINLDNVVFDKINFNTRLNSFVTFAINSCVWLITYFILLKITRLIPSLNIIRNESPQNYLKNT